MFKGILANSFGLWRLSFRRLRPLVDPSLDDVDRNWFRQALLIELVGVPPTRVLEVPVTARSSPNRQEAELLELFGRARPRVTRETVLHPTARGDELGRLSGLTSAQFKENKEQSGAAPRESCDPLLHAICATELKERPYAVRCRSRALALRLGQPRRELPCHF